MINFYKKGSLLALLFGTSLTIQAQTAPVVVQAESGTRSPDTVLDIRTEAGITYITPTATNASPSNAPQTESRVVTYTVIFPAAGTYDLYVRHRIGPLAGSDDSFYYGAGFGSKNLTADADWITVNENDARGYADPADVVGTEGSVPVMNWKWLKLSGFKGQNAAASELGVTFTVPEGQLTQTFQYGSREDGADINKFAFGVTGQTYTVATLDAATVTSLKADKAAFSFNLYPNPVTNGKIEINSLEKIRSVKVLNVRGNVVKEINAFNQTSGEVDLNVEPGMYIVQVFNGQSISSSKIVVY